MRELKSIEEKILDRTLYLIGKNHSCKISIRAIAKEAEVNVSAINYYFRSKEEMLNQAKELYILNSNSILDILKDDNLEEEDKLISAANEIMEYNIRYPGITVLLNDAAENDDDISKKIIEVSKDMSERVNHLLSVLINNEKSKLHQRMIFWAAINYPLENSVLNQSDSSVLEDKESRIAYIKYVLEILKK